MQCLVRLMVASVPVDDHDLRSLLALVLRRQGHEVVEIADGLRLRAELAMRCGHAVDRRRERVLVIVDVRLPLSDGLTVLRGWATQGPLPPFIVLSGYLDDEIRREARTLGALAIFDKPFNLDELRAAVRAAAAGGPA